MNFAKRLRRRENAKRGDSTRRHRAFERLEDRRLLAVGANNLNAGTDLRTYAFALATTVEFTEQVCTLSPDCNVMSSAETQQRSVVSQTLDTIVGAVNEVLRRELAIELALVPDNDLLISTGDTADDGYSEGSVFSVSRENSGVIEYRLTIGGLSTTGR
ncbi:MAG: hypothetical protein KDB00_12340 [Planctomycetales bacterium]|nr:hypothetical protein [Planctomycetales bacterium]